MRERELRGWDVLDQPSADADHAREGTGVDADRAGQDGRAGEAGRIHASRMDRITADLRQQRTHRARIRGAVVIAAGLIGADHDPAVSLGRVFEDLRGERTASARIEHEQQRLLLHRVVRVRQVERIGLRRI